MSRAGAQPTVQERAAAAAVLQMNAMAAETGHAPAAPGTGPVTPDAIMEVARGFMAAKHLFAASSIGIFEALADGPATVAEIATQAGIPERAAHISADAMVAGLPGAAAASGSHKRARGGSNIGRVSRARPESRATVEEPGHSQGLVRDRADQAVQGRERCPK